MQTPRPLWLIASVALAIITFAISTVSPLALGLLAIYALAVISPAKMPRDSANIWGLRLLLYALGAALGRSVGGPIYYYDARAFLTVGLILGGEIVLQTLREPPRGLRYDPVIVLLSGLLFLIACNTLSPHIFVLAPLYIFALVMALGEVRQSARIVSTATLTRVGLIAVAVSLGVGFHSALWVNRSNIMAVGARLLTGGSYSTGAESADLGENPQLGSSFAANASTGKLMEITGKLGDAHLRGAAFDLYAGGAWGPKISERATVGALPTLTCENVGCTNSGETRTDTDAKVTLLRPSNQVLYAPLNVSALVPKSGQGFDWSRYAGPLKTDDENLPLTYGVVNSTKNYDGAELFQGPLCVAPDAAQRARLLDVPPEIDSRVAALARNITLESSTQPEKIEAIVSYLLNNHDYSLNFARGSGDPVSEFLLSKKSAHCQYFAAGAVMLMRASGVPARYVSGFYAHEIADDGSTVIVRGRDAHAWAEAFVDGVGWVSVDATPSDGRADPRANPLPWYQKPLERAQDAFARVRAWFSKLTTLQILELMAVMLVIWSIERWRQSWRRNRVARRKSTVPLELAPLAQRFERALAKRGIILSPGQPWSEALPPDWERETRWVALYNRLRFNARDQSEIAKLAAELTQLEKENSRSN